LESLQAVFHAKRLTTFYQQGGFSVMLLENHLQD